MKTLFIIIICVCPFRAICQTAQNCSEIIRKADSAISKTNYSLALTKLRAFKICNPEAAVAADKKISYVFDLITAQRDSAIKAKKEADQQRAIAELEKRKAIQQAKISEAARLAAESQSMLANYPAAIDVSAKLAINSMQLYPSLQASEAVRKVLQIISPLDKIIHFTVSPEHVTINNNWAIFGGLDSEDFTEKLCIIDLKSSKIKHVIPYKEKFYIDQIVVSADSQFVAVGLTRMVDRVSRIEIRRIATADIVYSKNFEGYFKKLAITTDNKMLAVACGENCVQIFNILADQLLATIPYPKTYKFSLAQLSFNCSNQYLSIDDDYSLEIWKGWENATPVNIFQFTASLGGFYELEPCLPNSAFFAVAKSDSVFLYNWIDRKREKVFFIPGIRSIKFLKNNRMLTCSNDNGIGLWDISASKLSHSFFIGKNRLLKGELLVDPSEEFLITTNPDDGKTASIASFWNIQSGLETTRMYHSSYVQAVYPLGGTSAISIGQDHEIRKWKNKSDAELDYSFKNSISCYSISQDQTKLVIALKKSNSQSGRVIVFNNLTRSVLTGITTNKSIISIGFSRNNEDILFFTEKAFENWKDWKKGEGNIQTLYTFTDSPRRLIKSAIFNETGGFCVSTDGHGKIFCFKAPIWHMPEIISYSNPVYSRELDVSIEGLSVNKLGNKIAIGLTGGIAIVDVIKRQQIKFVNQYYRITKLAFDPNKNRLIFISGIKPKENFKNPDFAICIYNINSRETSIYPLETDGFIGSIDIHNSGELIAISNGRFARIYKLPQNNNKSLLIQSVIVRDKTINKCRFSPDGKFLITTYEDSFVPEEKLLFSYVFSKDLAQALINQLGSLWLDHGIPSIKF